MERGPFPSTKISHSQDRDTNTSTPVTMEATKVPRTEKVTMAPKFEKKGFCIKPSNNVSKDAISDGKTRKP